MSILAHGIDLVHLKTFNLTYNDLEAMKDCFTDKELAKIGKNAHSLERAAGRFATKEAVLKALGEGWTEGIALTDVEVLTDSGGAPSVNLSGRVETISVNQGITQWFVSISHDGQYAMASVIGTTKH